MTPDLHADLAREIDLAMLAQAKSPVLQLAMDNPHVEPSPVALFVAKSICAKYHISLLSAVPDLPADLVERCQRALKRLGLWCQENLCPPSFEAHGPWGQQCSCKERAELCANVLREAGVPALIAERDEAVRQWKNYEAVAVEHQVKMAKALDGASYWLGAMTPKRVRDEIDAALSRYRGEK